MRQVRFAIIACAFAITASASCKRDDGGVRVFTDEPYPEKISEWRFFQGAPDMLKPNKGLTVYDVNNGMFVDYAVVTRFIRVPHGKSAKYSGTDVFDFPEGTIVVQTFSYPVDETKPQGQHKLVETRVLVRTEAGWATLPYVWDDKGSDAALQVVGGTTMVDRKGGPGPKHIEYVIPNANQCRGCHENSGVMSPIGLSARQLNRDLTSEQQAENQLASWSKRGLLAGAPESSVAPRLPVWNNEKTGTVDQRARAYLETNCAHCHNAKGPAGYSGLQLGMGVSKPIEFGVCKMPFSAGRGAGKATFDIVPGDPEKSLIPFRMNSSEAGIMMPQFGRTVIHAEALELIRSWIRGVHGDCK